MLRHDVKPSSAACPINSLLKLKRVSVFHVSVLSIRPDALHYAQGAAAGGLEIKPIERGVISN